MVPNNFGVLHYSQDRFSEVVACVGRAIALEPKNPGAHFLLAQTYEMIGRIKRRSVYTNARSRSIQIGLKINGNYRHCFDGCLRGSQVML